MRRPGKGRQVKQGRRRRRVVDPSSPSVATLPPELRSPHGERVVRAVQSLDDAQRRRLAVLIGREAADRTIRAADAAVRGASLAAGAGSRGEGAEPRGRVVVINGIMGANLKVARAGGAAERVWVDLLQLVGGRFGDLALDLSGGPADPAVRVEVDGLHSSYLPLVAQLQGSWDVLAFGFDWRLDIDRSARALADAIATFADGQPAHIVAHSMGGLVARRMLQLFPDLWRSMDDTTGAGRGGRLIMLGTPNHGSFAASLALSGAEEQLKRLAFVDLDHSLADIQRIVCRFAGCYQMLPSPLLDFDDDRRALYDWVAWGPHPVEADLLARAERFHDELRAAVDPARMIYVAGFDVETPSRVRVRRAGVFAYESTRDGDGRVPHGLGRLDGVPMHWVRRGVHGDLPMNGLVLDAIDQLLRTGSSERLPAGHEPPADEAPGPRGWIAGAGGASERGGAGLRPGGRTSKGRRVAIAAPDRVDHVDGDEFRALARKAQTAQRSAAASTLSPRDAARLEAMLLAGFVGSGAHHGARAKATTRTKPKAKTKTKAKTKAKATPKTTAKTRTKTTPRSKRAAKAASRRKPSSRRRA